ncbi:hypothetical protein ACAH01_07375 [Halomicrobium sp. HM KBTZ05]|uniref:DUF2064 domain-containing protein n=1 Tax=Halomicrobium mukohataei TaxID=57705 RepID=A0A847UEP6_9EURY|nr:hypothetical protein [Halomicrobium mukohataei]NLV10966.1 hypothetical protein [Halomicrobium mukohataei]
MTTVAVMAEPPESGAVLTDLVERDRLTTDEASELYAAMLADVCEAIDGSGAELLVNYRADEQVPSEDGASEREVRSALDGVVDTDEVRFEVQVGSTESARAGNTITHLLEREGVRTAAVVRPTAALLGRQHIDTAAMKLRSNGVVLGPSTAGRISYAGFAEPIDFEDAFQTPTVETLVQRATDAGLAVDFLPTIPVVEQDADLPTVVPLLRARNRADRLVPTRTTAALDEFGFDVVDRDGTATVVRP